MANLVKELQDPSAYPHPTEEISIVETHISLVFLTGPYAYKIKKAVNLGFLDFSTLESREYFCREELRLNKRLCRELYLDVVPITEQSGKTMIGGNGRIIDYAVKMIQFDRNMEIDTLLARNRITGKQIDQISRTVAEFHESTPAAEPDTPYGRPETLVKPVRDNFTETERLNRNRHEAELLEKLKQWTETEYRRRIPLFTFRKASGCIRECHGDMHTGNMVLWRKKVMIFDCIEFNRTLSNIDVISEIAFLVMDLEHSGHPEHAWNFLNDYLSLTGDYEGLPLLRFYKTYRAMVRAKVTAIRYLQEHDPGEKKKTFAEHCSYVSTAVDYTTPGAFGLVITCGVSGSGKTTAARKFASLMQAVHIRSDIERKRLFGLKHLEKSSPEQSRTMYSDNSSDATYTRLCEIATICLTNGYTVIVDATFLRHEERERFIALGKKRGCPMVILHCKAPEKLLEERVRKRHEHGRDASEADHAILLDQLQNVLPLSAEEEKITVTIDTSQPSSIESGMKETMARIRTDS